MTTDSNPHRFTEIRHVAVTGSTNSDILEAGRRGDREGVVLVAGVQTAGRGRHGRTWVAPPGSGLLFSVLLRPPVEVADLVTPMTALAVADAASALGAAGLGIKWPNDVVAIASGGNGPVRSEPKIAGILAEADWTVGTTPAGGPRPPRNRERVLVALGVGLNLTSASDFPPEVLERRVALEDLGVPRPSADAVLDVLLRALDDWYTRLENDRWDVLGSLRQRCITIGRRVRVDLGARDLIGRATDVDASGRLVVSCDDGTEQVVAAGDVVHLRDAR